MRLSISILALLGICAALVGCGESESSSDSGAATTIAESSITKPEFVKQANEICERRKNQVVSQSFALSQRKDLPKRQIEQTAGKEVLQPLINAQVQELSELGAPPGDKQEIEAFLTSLSRAVDKVADEGIAGIKESHKVLQPVGDMAYAYGIDECAIGY